MDDPAGRIAQGVAERIDRRRFFRRAASGTFYVVALWAAGGIRSLAYADLTDTITTSGTCYGPGPGCPSGGYTNNPCGPSRCCNYIRSGAPASCDCSVGSNTATCKTHDSTGTVTRTTSPNCYSKDLRHYMSTSCWTCVGPCYSCGDLQKCKIVTTCCDCKTNKSNCNDPDIDGTNRGRCIAYNSIITPC